jgi:hypothetical protein
MEGTRNSGAPREFAPPINTGVTVKNGRSNWVILESPLLEQYERFLGTKSPDNKYYILEFLLETRKT